MPRLFVAIDLPSDIKLGLSRFRSAVSGVRWVAPENFHLTLRFIGDVDDAAETAISDVLRHIEMSRFSLSLAGVGQFGGHTMWVGVEPSRALLRLQDAIENALKEVAPAVDPRPFRPHVKLARSRRRRGFESFLAEHSGFHAEPFEVGTFSLIESHPGKSGSIYQHRADYPLLGGEKAPHAVTSADTAASDSASR
jgi:RNA 2',3'-cyclic 3'-phosphodiesterase